MYLAKRNTLARIHPSTAAYCPTEESVKVQSIRTHIGDTLINSHLKLSTDHQVGLGGHRRELGEENIRPWGASHARTWLLPPSAGCRPWRRRYCFSWFSECIQQNKKYTPQYKVSAAMSSICTVIFFILHIPGLTLSQKQNGPDRQTQPHNKKIQ